VEDHLADCASCRAELEDLYQLSAQLKLLQPAGMSLTADRFTAQVIMRLPSRPDRSKPQSIAIVIWWMFPAALLLAWAFIQTTNHVSDLFNVLLGAGILRNSSGWILANSQSGNWYADLLRWVQSSLTNSGWLGIQLLGDVQLIILNLLYSLIPMAVLGVLLWSWLAGWWVYQREGAGYKLMKGLK
jgi:hypothetical protein